MSFIAGDSLMTNVNFTEAKVEHDSTLQLAMVSCHSVVLINENLAEYNAEAKCVNSVWEVLQDALFIANDRTKRCKKYQYSNRSL